VFCIYLGSLCKCFGIQMDQYETLYNRLVHSKCTLFYRYIIQVLVLILVLHIGIQMDQYETLYNRLIQRAEERWVGGAEDVHVDQVTTLHIRVPYSVE
jgi:putative lipoic acid-binding regulatory protein